MDKVLSRFGLGLAVLLASTLAIEAPASHPDQSQWVPEFAAEVASGIARQGNEAVQRIRREARLAVRAARPAPLSELTQSAPTEVAAE